MTRTLLILFALSLPTTSCTLAKISAAGPRPLLLNNPQGQQFDVIKHFNIERRITFDYTNSVEADELVAEVIQETGADAIINLRIKLKYDISDYCLDQITCGLAHSRTWQITGDAVKYK